MSVVLHWNGKDVPQELRSLPEGRYVVDAVDTAPELSPDEEAGLEAALESLRQGRGVDASVVFCKSAAADGQKMTGFTERDFESAARPHPTGYRQVPRVQDHPAADPVRHAGQQ